MPLTILYVEDDKIVSDAVAEILGAQGWRVQTCEDGSKALAPIESAAHFDLLMLDDELPGVSGLELARRGRMMAHRAWIPIIVVSASEVSAEARRVGADVFLRKPQDVGLIVGTVRGLVER